MKNLRITHRDTGTLLAEGPIGWGITPFEGNLYFRKKYVKSAGFMTNYCTGLCVYKFLYVWMDLYVGEEKRVRNIAWMYWLPNPLFPFIWFRVALPRSHPDIDIEVY